MNDKDFVFDFYIGEDNDSEAEKTKNAVAENGLPLEVESEILLNSFAEEDPLNHDEKKQNIFHKFINWWKNRKKRQKAAIIVLVSVVLVASILLSIFLSGFGYNYNRITGDHADLGIENVIDKDIVNVALFGIDTRSLSSFKGNSDSIMILSLNTNTKMVKIISLVRDTFIPITYNGITTYNKINSAYAKGGPELAIKVINTNFGLDITEYATVNFFGMVDIIDAVGGIEAELTQAEVVNASKNSYAINGCIYEICNSLGISPKSHYVTSAGKQHLNGIQAVAYSRIRYVANIWGTNNDYGRTDRQRYVMEQLFNKALTMEKTQYVKLVKSLIPCTETSLSYSEILGLAFDMLLESPSFEQARIPRDDMLMTQPKTSAGSVVYYDLDFAEKLIHAFIYDDISFDEYVETNGVEKNDWYRGATSTRRPSSNTASSSSNSNNSSDDKDITSSNGSNTTSSSDEDSDNTSSNSSDNTSTEPSDSADSSGTESGESSEDSGDNSNDDTSSDDTDSSDESTPSDESDTTDTPTESNESDSTDSPTTSDESNTTDTPNTDNSNGSGTDTPASSNTTNTPTPSNNQGSGNTPNNTVPN